MVGVPKGGDMQLDRSGGKGQVSTKERCRLAQRREGEGTWLLARDLYIGDRKKGGHGWGVRVAVGA